MKEDTEMLNPQSTSQRWGRDVCFLCRVLVGHIAGSRGTFSRSARAEIRKEIGLQAYDEEIIFARISTSSGMIPREMYLRLLGWFDAN